MNRLEIDSSCNSQNETYAFPLSFAQQRLWFLQHLDPDSSTYNVPTAVRLRGELNVAALQHSFDRLIERHEILRTTFALRDSEAVQIVHPALPAAISNTDLRDFEASRREETLQSLLQFDARKPFDLDRGPLLRVQLIRIQDDDQVLALNMHHIVSDGWSMDVLFRELSALYQGYCAGSPASMPELPIQYADYSVWQRDWLQGDNLNSQLSYWRKQLDGLSTLQVPMDHPRPPMQTYRGSSVSMEFPNSLALALKGLSQRHGVTLFMTLLAAFQTLLHRYSGQDDITVGTPIAGRTREETEALIGFFVNTLVLRADLSNNPSFTELLRQVRETTLEAYTHQDLPFEKLVEELHPERDPSISPLFQVLFALQNAGDSALELEGLNAFPIRSATNIVKFDLSLTMFESDGKLLGSLNYNTDLFEAATIERMAGHFQILLEGIVANPEQPVSELPLLSEAETHQLLVEWNDTRTDYPEDKCIHQLFEAQVEKTPDAIALVFGDQQLTYRELNTKANQLAHYLRKLDVGPDVPVGICLERSIEMIVGLLAILKAGGAYVPLDSNYPQERLAFMIRDTGIKVLLTHGRLQAKLPAHQVRIICLDRDWLKTTRESVSNPDQPINPDCLAYVIYTSGSTGLPKGVEVPHRGVVRLVFGNDYATFGAKEVFLQLAPTLFDAATFEIWAPLLHGARCVLFPGSVPAPEELGSILRTHRVSILWLTASLFNSIIDQAPEALSEVRMVLTGGEVLSVEHIRRAQELLPNTTFVNGYGPTESTTFTCCYTIPKLTDNPLLSIPIGRPIGNTDVYILDKRLTPVPIGVAGELHVGGAGLARGYLNQPQQTAEKFIRHCLPQRGIQRLYKTGDLARYLPNGNIEFLGRIDHQVKIHGYRIELGEIETVIMRHPGVQAAVVDARDVAPGDKRMVAYIAAKSDTNPTPSELRSYLCEKLPDYMVPSAYVFLDTLPLTPNGKIDHSRLPLAESYQWPADSEYVEPRNSTEKLLAKIWGESLKVDRVGIHDNFFELGGHSLLAVRLTHLVQKQFGRPVRVADIFQAPTIEQFAQLLSAGSEPTWTSLVALNTQGSGRPFFWVHGEISDHYLPRHFGPNQPLYGFRHQSEDGTPARFTTVEKLAAHYMQELRSVQPQGPYLIGGYCFGGLITLEIAKQLRSQGQAVEQLILVNPSLGEKSNGRARNLYPTAPGLIWSLDSHRRAVAGRALLDKIHYLLTKTSGKIKGISSGFLRPVRKIAQKLTWTICIWFRFPIPEPIRSPYILEIYRKAMRNYTPSQHNENVILLRTQDYSDRLRTKWSDLCRGARVDREVPGDHVTVLNEPNIGVWAKELKKQIDAARVVRADSTGNRRDVSDGSVSKPVTVTRVTSARVS
jgi:amino acid adenylation domain-containing protein